MFIHWVARHYILSEMRYTIINHFIIVDISSDIWGEKIGKYIRKTRVDFIWENSLEFI